MIWSVVGENSLEKDGLDVFVRVMLISICFVFIVRSFVSAIERLVKSLLSEILLGALLSGAHEVTRSIQIIREENWDFECITYF